MRLTLVLGLVLLVWALPELTRRLGGRVAVALWVAVANPMMIIHMVGGGHNDLLVMGLLAAGSLFALRGRHVVGIVLVTAAMAVKASAGVALPFLVLVWAAHLSGSRTARITKAAAAGIGVFAGVFAAITLAARVDLGWLPALSAPSMIVNWMSLPTGVGEFVHWLFEIPFDLPKQPFINVARIIGGDRAAGDRRPAVVGRARRRPGRHPAGRDRAAGGRGALAGDAALVRQLGHGADRRGAVVAPGAVVAGVLLADAGDRLLPQRRGRALQLALPGRLRRAVRAGRGVAAPGRPAAPAAARPGRTRPPSPTSSRMPGSGAAELDAAGITDPALRAAYATCRALNAAHGRTYFLATRLLPAARRPAVHALYGFARYADEIVDDLDDDRPVAEKAAELDALTADLEAALDGAPDGPPRPRRAGRHRPPLRHRPAALRRLHGVDADGHHRHRVRDLRRPGRLRARVGGGDRPADAADPRHAGAAGGGRAARRGARAWRSSSRTSCATSARTSTAAASTCLLDELAAFGVDRELLAWCRRTRAARSAGAPRAGPPRRPHPRHLPARASRASRCWSRCRGPAWAARSPSTRASSTRSRRPTTTCCTAGSRCRTGGARPSRCPAWPGRWSPARGR